MKDTVLIILISFSIWNIDFVLENLAIIQNILFIMPFLPEVGNEIKYFFLKIHSLCQLKEESRHIQKYI